MSNPSLYDNLASRISTLLKSARQRVVRSVNQTMVLIYFEIGRLIFEEEQKGEERAGYGTQLIDDLSAMLTNEFGKGFSATNLKQVRQFYLIYSNRQTLPVESEKGQTLSDEFKLSWSHYLKLMRIEDENERRFYEKLKKSINLYILEGLPAEREFRRKQHEYYRSKLLSFKPFEN
ncbi:MAG: DUF1016 N-terminal domain-containing protein [Chitinophagaceae bacterium]